MDALFARALELDEGERTSFLDAECGSDADLRAEVESMLRFARASQEFLEQAAFADMTTLAGETTPVVPGHHSPDHGRFIPGDVVAGRYRIAGLLGRGGMGEVYRADDLKLGQPVALKFLSETLARNGAALARFHREVSLARQISHRHVCRVFDIGEHAGMHFLSMEYVRGEELSSLLKRVGRLPLEKAIETARQLCAGLAAIHAAGVLHRDLKPANVMVDEHGDVRITDFGIAALSQDIASEAMMGTPAYMAPEQFAGGEVTQRSDVYALGLILYETFTGKRAFTASSLEEVIEAHRTDTAPTSPSTWVADLDPLVERVILRCLEKDPERRPAGALHVAAALPGGDPLAAALAAGETPSPQMVAASATHDGLRPLVALLLLLAIFSGFAIATVLSARVSLHHYVPLARSPELLRADAEELARQDGFATPAADTASGFELDFAVVQYVVGQVGQTADAWERFRAAPLPAVQFWYRRSPRPLEPYSDWRVGMHDPPNVLAGMVRMRLDTAGRVIFYEAVPPVVDALEQRSRPVDWSRFFESAGLDINAFRPTASRWTPPQQSDSRVAWTGSHPQRPDLPLRIEAASYRGAPVYFEVIWPWSSTERRPATFSDASSDPFSVVILIIYFGTLALGALLAWRNLRLGRGDRRGTIRLMLFVFVARLVFWAFIAHHVAALGELALLIAGLRAALYWTAILGLFYLALEPFVRRRWPKTLISWSRFLGGDLRDPLLGRDVLIGGAYGIAILLTRHLSVILPPLLGRPLRMPAVNSPLLYEHGFDGARGFVPLLINGISASFLFPLIITSIVVFFAMVTRRNWAGLALSWVLLYAALLLNAGDDSVVGYLLGLVAPTILLVVLIRHGLLALISLFFFVHLAPFYPITTDLTAWYATSYVLALLVFGAVAVFAFRTSLGGQKVLSGAFLEP